MAKTAAIICRTKERSRVEPPLARRIAELAARAQSVLAAPDSLWASLPNLQQTRTRLAIASAELRSAEDSFYAGMALRLDLLVRRQALDRECWDYLAHVRQRLKPVLGHEWSQKWDSLGFTPLAPKRPSARSQTGRSRKKSKDSPDQIKFSFAPAEPATVASGPGMPSEYAGRFRALRLVIEHYGPEDAAKLGLMLELGAALLKKMAGLNSETADLRLKLRAASQTMRKIEETLKKQIEMIRKALWKKLHKADPRWVFLQPTATAAVASARRLRSDLSVQPPRYEPALPSHPAVALNPTENLSIYSAISWLLPVD